jgi:streptomycin 3"-kinase
MNARSSDDPIDFARLLPHTPAGVDWARIDHGESGDAVYRRGDGVAFAKIASGTAVAALNGERERLQWLAGSGVAVPGVLDWIGGDDSACLVTAAFAGVPASALSASDLLAVWTSIVRQLKSLHALPVDACPFERDLATMFAKAEDVVARNAVNADFLDDERRKLPPSRLLDDLRGELAERLAQERGDCVVCHGDACMPNFIVDPDTLRCIGMIDLGRLGRADRYVDLSLLLANAGESWNAPEQAAEAHRRTFHELGLHADEARLRFYLHLDPLTWG